MWSYHDITVNRPDLKGRECVVWKEPVYPDTWFVVRLDGDEDVTVKARASNLKVIRSQCGGSPPDDSPSAASPSPALNHREDDVGPATQPESSAGNDRNTGTPEEALGRWLCADVFESFVYSNSLDPDGSETHKLLQVARAEIMPGLYRVLHGTPMTRESDESGSDWDQDYSILSPTAVMSLWRHLDAGKYQTFKAWVGDVRRLFAYAYQLPLSEADSWRIQVAESWFDSALICAGQLSQCKPPPVPKTTPSDWPGSSTQLHPTLSLTAADRSIDIVKIVAALLRECGGAATPAMVPQTVTAPSPPG